MNLVQLRGTARGFLGLLCAVCILCGVGRGQTVVSVGMTVDDMDRSVAFYTDVLKFKKTADEEVVGAPAERVTGVFGMRARVVRLSLGDQTLELTQYLTPQGRLIPRDSRSNDLWFQHIAIVVGDMDDAYAHLRRHKIKFASTGPQRLPDWNPNAGGIRAFYFRDPDDHVLEIIWFPPGKGDPKWRDKSGLFLGIDHTAIVVADTEKSLAFYRNVLGMKVVGASENYGDEQAHLNNVRDAHVRITTLRGPDGPGVELLQYLNPGRGRAYPTDSQPNDLWHWHTTLSVRDAEALRNRLRQSGYTVASDGLVDLRGARADAAWGLLARDPDGHAVQLIQP